jgi:hypothetical protein
VVYGRFNVFNIIIASFGRMKDESYLNWQKKNGKRIYTVYFLIYFSAAIEEAISKFN